MARSWGRWVHSGALLGSPVSLVFVGFVRAALGVVGLIWLSWVNSSAS